MNTAFRSEHQRIPGQGRPLAREAMLARVARFRDRSADPGAFPDLQAQGGKRNVAYVISPEGLGGPAPIEAPHGFHLSISQLSPGIRPTVHSHPYTEVFMPLDQPFRLLWGEAPEQSIDLDRFDVASVPAGVFRTFENVGTEVGHMLALFDHGGDPHTGIVVPPDVFERFYRNWNPGMVGVQA